MAGWTNERPGLCYIAYSIEATTTAYGVYKCIYMCVSIYTCVFLHSQRGRVGVVSASFTKSIQQKEEEKKKEEE
jgi:hypothetical protein